MNGTGMLFMAAIGMGAVPFCIAAWRYICQEYAAIICAQRDGKDLRGDLRESWYDGQNLHVLTASDRT